jgi:hypothetical protein
MRDNYDIGYGLAFKMNCVECGQPAPRGFALCDPCAETVYTSLGALLLRASIKKLDEDDTTTPEAKAPDAP